MSVSHEPSFYALWGWKMNYSVTCKRKAVAIITVDFEPNIPFQSRHDSVMMEVHLHFQVRHEAKVRILRLYFQKNFFSF